jgi:hypothetical protein
MMDVWFGANVAGLPRAIGSEKVRLNRESEAPEKVSWTNARKKIYEYGHISRLSGSSFYTPLCCQNF